MKNANTIRLISIIGTVVVFTLLVVLIFQFINIANLNNKQNELNSALGSLQEQIVDASNLNEYQQTDEYLDNFARENLGWGRENEIIYK